jgi:hypothetical protein
MADTTDHRQADHDLATGATVTIAQFRAVLQGFPATRPWGATSPEVEVHAMTSPIELSQTAQQDLRGLFGNRVMPKILAALDQLPPAPTAGVTAWQHLAVGDYQVHYRPLPAGYLVAGVTRHRDSRCSAHAVTPPPDRPAANCRLTLTAVSRP